MPKVIYLLLLLISIQTGVSSQQFKPQQKAWLYRIVSKTPCLKRNWDNYFTYKGGITESTQVSYVKNGRTLSYHISLWDSIEQDIISHPHLLEVNWEKVSKSSPGLIADAAVKLAMWELYSNVKQGYVDVPAFGVNKTAKHIHQEMVKSLPKAMRGNGVVKEKYLPVFYKLINPSLNIGRKQKAFLDIKKVSLSEQERVFAKWHKLVNGYVNEKSEFYFSQLLGKQVYFSGHLLAAGDGSGSSGLLYEWESGEEGAEINTGTGKGIGLFTYEMRLRKEQLVPLYKTKTKIKTLKNEPTLLHFTLWGMDWDKKPLVVVKKGDKSYLLYGSVEFSPDHQWKKGVSYVDRMADFKNRKIDFVVSELNKDGGLLAVYERERVLRDKIQVLIDVCNLEIDSLKEIENPSETAIKQRLYRNETNLSNLSDKERRLSDVQKKISVEYKKIDRAQKELGKMRDELGEFVQKWEKVDSLYLFEDGSQFNMLTQDLILFNDSNNTESIQIKLLPATYSIYSDTKDEVQLYVNATGGVNEYLKANEKTKESIVKFDTLVNKSCYFNPDEFSLSSFFTVEELKMITGLNKLLHSKNKLLKLNLVAHGVDSVNHPYISKDRENYILKKDNVNYTKARRVDIKIIETEKHILVYIAGFADAGRTRLSKLPEAIKHSVVELNNKKQSLNPALSALRVQAVVKQIEKLLDVHFSKEGIYVSPLQRTITLDTL